MGKKIKDLDPKGRAKKVKGGGLEQDQQNINRSKKAIVDDIAVRQVKNAGPTTSKAVKGLFK